MTDYLVELFNMFTAYAIGFPLLLYPMWKTRNVKNSFIYAYIISFTVLISAALLVARQFMVIDLSTFQGFKLYFLPLQCVLPFIVFRKKVWQVIFLISVYTLYGIIFVGIGNFLAKIYFPESPLLHASLISNAVIAATFPLLIIILRRMYGSPGAEQATAFWRLSWIVPVMFSLIILVPGNYVTGNDFGGWFIIIRVFAYAVSLFICYMFDVASRQISEAVIAKQKIEFYRKMSHSLRTPLTIVSTNIQTAKRRPEEADELLAKSQAEIMKMAGMISDALQDYDKGAGE